MGGHFGLTISIPKTKGPAMGVASEGDVSSVEVEMIEMVKDFTYLGLNLSSDGETTCEVNCRIAETSKDFGSLWISIFSILRELSTMQ